MANDVISIRGTDEQREKFNEIAENYSNKGEAFQAILKAYEESKALSDNENRIQLEHVRGLCDALYQAYNNLMLGQAAELGMVQRDYKIKIDDLSEQLESIKEDLEESEHIRIRLNEDLKTLQEENTHLKKLNASLADQLAAAQSLQESLGKMQELLSAGQTRTAAKTRVKKND